MDIKQYKREGFVGPKVFCDKGQAEIWRRSFFDAIGQSVNHPHRCEQNLSAFHQKYKWAYDICIQPTILETISRCLESDDVVLWAMHFWYKEPGNQKYIPWHQDKNYWPMHPTINATAWVSLGESNLTNGCLRLVKGSHLHDYQHSPQGEDSAFQEGIENVDESKINNVEMNPGEVVFFNESTIHGSNVNSSSIPRVACSIRYTVPKVKFNIDNWTGDKSRIKTYLVKGEDKHRFNDHIIGEIPKF